VRLDEVAIGIDYDLPERGWDLLDLGEADLEVLLGGAQVLDVAGVLEERDPKAVRRDRQLDAVSGRWGLLGPLAELIGLAGRVDLEGSLDSGLARAPGEEGGH
jgi:hypothetical protein